MKPEYGPMIQRAYAELEDRRPMLEVTPAVLACAKRIKASCPVRAAGYRIKIKPLESDKGLSAGEAAQAPTLASMGFEAKTERQKARESKGADTALVVDVGPIAYKGEQIGPEPWVRVGDVIEYLRYAGHTFQEPPGSGNEYRIINDEDVLGIYEEAP